MKSVLLLVPLLGALGWSAAAPPCWGQSLAPVRPPSPRPVTPPPLPAPTKKAPVTPAPVKKAPRIIVPPLPTRPAREFEEAGALPPQTNFGIDLEALAQVRRHTAYLLDGSPATRAQAYEQVQRGALDDAGKCRVTVIGTKEERAPFVADWQAPDNADLAGRCRLWCVDRAHWSLQDAVTGAALFHTAGRPTVYCQAPDGEVLHRQDDYGGSRDFEALRRAVKSYDARNDPDLRRTAPAMSNAPLWILGGLAALLLLKGKDR